MDNNNQSQALIPKKNNNTGLVVALVAVLSILIIAVIILIVILMTKNNEEEAAKQAEEDRIASISIKQADDISRFMVAANDYQVNNNGKTPWHYGYTNTKFVRRYIDDSCTKETPDEIDETCSKNFRDPLDNKPYYFNVRSILIGEKEKVTFANNHEIAAYTNAYCDEDGYVLKGTSIRQYALLYKLANGKVTCIDNH